MPKPRPAPHYKPLSEAAVLQIDNTVLRVLDQVGVEVNCPEAVELFVAAGAERAANGRVVRFPPDLVRELIDRAPGVVTLCGRESAYDAVLEPGAVWFGTGGTALYVLDPGASERRKADLADMHRIARMCHELDNLHVYMLPVFPTDVSEDHIDVNRFFAGFANTSKHVMGGVYTKEGVARVIEMAEEIAGSPEDLRRRPFLSMITCVISPLKLDRHYTELLMQVAGAGIPVVCPSEPVCGLTSPVTLAGNTVIQVADSLTGVMLAQLVNPGTPTIFGSVSGVPSFRDMRYLAGPVEVGILSAAQAQMARFYDLPFYSVGGMSDAKVPDAQSGYESATTTLLNALAGANFVHDAVGLCDHALTMSYEKAIIDDEIIGMALRAAEGIEVTEETLCFDAISEVGPGGDYLTHPTTTQFMRREHYFPQLANRLEQQAWRDAGAPELREAAGTQATAILAAEYRLKLPDELVDMLMRRYPEIRLPEDPLRLPTTQSADQDGASGGNKSQGD